MRPKAKADVTGHTATIRYFCASRLTEAQLERWRAFAEHVPWAHPLQDPAWAEIERQGSGMSLREPVFFWSELDGAVCLTALGVRRRLPIPGRTFWEFKKGPTFLDAGVLDEWLAWLVDAVGCEAARLHVEPAVPLDEGGDDVETLLERHGFVRRRAMGTWATLTIDIGREEEAILASFKCQTRAQIRRSRGLGVDVGEEDTPEGWAVLSKLNAEMALRTAVRPVDGETIARISRSWLAGTSGGTILVARHNNEPLAAILVIRHRQTAHLWMLPSSRRRERLPAGHPLIWEAMRWAKRNGCTWFDLGGYSLMARPGDNLWGVNQFKRGFAPNERPRKSVAIHERVFSPVIVASAATIRRLQAWMRRFTEDHQE